MIRALVVVGCLCLATGSAFGQMLPFDVVAQTGQTAPGVGSPFTSLNAQPRIGANGQVSFSGIANSKIGYWVGTPASLSLAALTGNPAPEMPPGTTYFSLGTYANVRADGNVVLGAQLDPPGNLSAVYSGLPGAASSLVARNGQQAPGYDAGQLFSGVSTAPASNSLGGVSFVGSVVNGGTVTNMNDQGLWAGVPGSVSLVVREGQSAPGASGPAPTFGTTDFSSFILSNAINDAGQVAFMTRLNGAGFNSTAIYVYTPSSGLALATQIGMVAPGTSPTITFSNYGNGVTSRPGFNSAGQVAFIATLSSDVPGEVSFVNNTGVWAGAAGNVQLVVRSGTTAPLPGTVLFRDPLSDPRINASGQVTWMGLVSGTGVVGGTNDRVLWRNTGGTTEVIARDGDHAPGTLAGVNFDVIDATPAINDQGAVAFTASLIGTGVTSGNSRGLWAGTPSNVSLIARTGEVIDIDPTDGVLLRTISTISFANGHSTDISAGDAAFNAAGLIAWQATFVEGGSAVFTTVVPVPEPTGVLALSALGLFGLRLARRRRASSCAP